MNISIFRRISIFVDYVFDDEAPSVTGIENDLLIINGSQPKQKSLKNKTYSKHKPEKNIIETNF
jgi:hypothetical protein